MLIITSTGAMHQQGIYELSPELTPDEISREILAHSHIVSVVAYQDAIRALTEISGITLNVTEKETHVPNNGDVFLICRLRVRVAASKKRTFSKFANDDYVVQKCTYSTR